MNKYTQEKIPDKLISWNIDRKTKWKENLFFFSREISRLIHKNLFYRKKNTYEKENMN